MKSVKWQKSKVFFCYTVNPQTSWIKQIKSASFTNQGKNHLQLEELKFNKSIIYADHRFHRPVHGLKSIYSSLVKSATMLKIKNNMIKFTSIKFVNNIIYFLSLIMFWVPQIRG